MKKLEELYDWYENLSKESLFHISSFYTKDAYFKDPFNEVKSVSKIENIYRDMFAKLGNPKFVFIDKINQGNQAFVTWNFTFNIGNKNYIIHGSSHLKFNEESLIFYHRDYWDVGEELLTKLPLIKGLYGVLRRKLGSS